jgi:hypothetical protein
MANLPDITETGDTADVSSPPLAVPNYYTTDQTVQRTAAPNLETEESKLKHPISPSQENIGNSGRASEAQK